MPPKIFCAKIILLLHLRSRQTLRTRREVEIVENILIALAVSVVGSTIGSALGGVIAYYIIRKVRKQ